ncbi:MULTISPECIES: hypothetical protein [unclassified Pseudomonas]|uniref:hypothetical protein n=1 Tax=unclassified Pseudomonas TaxID=196821 RepID=UPI002E803041|nr:hypothetical protein [Pseudomonas sp. 10C3]MEE3507584.1 hypothetical protein [Pseudomonas sp. 10C3]
MPSKELVWTGPSGTTLPASCSDPQDIVQYANGLNDKQKRDIARAFEHGAYDMGAEYTWRRAMVRLKSTLKTLGMGFIGEMLNDDDIDEYSNIDIVLNDYSAINLAEQLGAINSTGALKLRHALEVISHFLSDEAEKNNEELSKIDAASLVGSCVRYVLGETDISIAIEFSELRNRLFSETLSLADPQIQQLLDSPPFYIKTVVSVLLSGIKNEQGAAQEHAVGNLGVLIHSIWNHIPEKDKWQIGNAYRDATAAGDISAAKGLKNALLKVKGFDYVPENLRSSTFRKAAKSLIDAHFSINNFYTEAPLVASLSKLGSSIPAPAFIECVQAYLCVYLGNSYGISHAAFPIAKAELLKIPEDRWRYYFDKVVASDEIILAKLLSDKPIKKFSTLIQDHLGFLVDSESLNTEVLKLVKALNDGNEGRVSAIARKLYDKIRGK